MALHETRSPAVSLVPDTPEQLILCKVTGNGIHPSQNYQDLSQIPSALSNVPGSLNLPGPNLSGPLSISRFQKSPAVNCVELFCGRAEVTGSFKSRGHNTFCTDKRKRAGVCIPDLQIPMEKLSRSMIPFDHIHFIWASVPCTAFSYGAGDYYYDGKYAKQNALQFLKLLNVTLEFITECNPDFFFIENPRGKLRYEKSMVDWCVKSVAVIKEITLGSYGFSTIKPTDIFTNAYDWQPRPKLPYGRGAKNSGGLLTNLTQVQRQATPPALADELCDYIETAFSAPFKSNLP